MNYPIVDPASDSRHLKLRFNAAFPAEWKIHFQRNWGSKEMTGLPIAQYGTDSIELQCGKTEYEGIREDIIHAVDFANARYEEHLKKL